MTHTATDVGASNGISVMPTARGGDAPPPRPELRPYPLEAVIDSHHSGKTHPHIGLAESKKSHYFY